MATHLNPYLNFTDRTRDAFTFYQSVLGGQLHIMTFGDAGLADMPEHLVMHARLDTADGFVLMGSDVPEVMRGGFVAGTNMSINISGDDADVLTRYFVGLSEGGQVTMPLEMQMWGDRFGMCTDKFGINWMVNINSSGDPQG